MGTVLGERIRLATAARHSALETDLGLMGHVLTLSSHRRLLERFFGFVAVWEPLIESWLGSWYQNRRKLPWLVDDLAYLGVPASVVNALPRCGNLPGLSSLDEAVGSLYVMEGSTLGGQLIARRIESVLGLKNGAGYAYYRGYGAETGSRWKEFRALLDSRSSEQADESIIRSADATFASIHAWLVPGKASL